MSFVSKFFFKSDQNSEKENFWKWPNVSNWGRLYTVNHSSSSDQGSKSGQNKVWELTVLQPIDLQRHTVPFLKNFINIYAKGKKITIALVLGQILLIWNTPKLLCSMAIDFEWLTQWWKKVLQIWIFDSWKELWKQTCQIRIVNIEFYDDR